MLVRRWALVAVVALGAGACSGGRDDTPDPTVPTDPATSVSASSTTATAPDVAAIPPVIDEAYLNAVLAALDRVDGDAARLIVAKKDLVPEAAERLAAIYDDREFEDQTNGWLTTLERDPQLTSLSTNPGDRKTRVARVIAASSACVWLAVTRDYAATARRPTGAIYTEYVGLRPLDPSNDPRGRNPTRWMIQESGFNQDGSEPENPCRPG